MAALLGMLVIVGCGEQATQPTSEEAIPTTSSPLTGNGVPTPTPTPDASQSPDTVLIDVTRDHLPAMVLAHSEIQLEFPFLQLEPTLTGYQDNEQAAGQTMDPNDTSGDLAERGRLDGYETEFVDSAVQASGLTSQERPLGLSVSLNLMETPESARRYLKDQMDEIQRFQGVDVDGTIVNEFRQAELAGLVEYAVADCVTIAIAAFGATAQAGVVLWQRGPIVAIVGVTGFDDSDRSAAIERLARQMDRRIKRVLAGEIPPALITPTATAPSTPTVVGGSGEETPAWAVPPNPRIPY